MPPRKKSLVTELTGLDAPSDVSEAPQSVVVPDAVPEVVIVPSVPVLHVVNAGQFALYVPLASGEVRLSPKQDVVVRATEVTDATRRLAGQGALVIS